MQEQPADRRNQELMNALGKLKLALPPASQRDIWYQAGLEAGRRNANAWKALAAIVTLSAGLAFTLDRRHAPAPRAAYVQHVEHPATITAPATANASLAYERVRNRLVEDGLSGLPPIDFSGDGGSPPTAPAHSNDREDVPSMPEYWEKN